MRTATCVVTVLFTLPVHAQTSNVSALPLQCVYTTQTVSVDGHTVLASESGTFMRDSSGRTRIDLPDRSMITDTKSGILYLLTPATKTYHTVRISMNSAPVSPSTQVKAIGPGLARSADHQTLQGMPVTHVVIAQSGAAGHVERWVSEDLHIPLKTATTDAQGRMTTVTYTSIQQTPPDSSLFHPPAGYTELSAITPRMGGVR